MIFTIKEVILRNGKKIYIPLARQATKPYFFNLYTNQWQRIIKIYNKYILLDIFEDTEDLGLTIDDCCDHINGYMEYCEKMRGNEVKTVSYHDASKFEIINDVQINKSGSINTKHFIKSHIL